MLLHYAVHLRQRSSVCSRRTGFTARHGDPAGSAMQTLLGLVSSFE